MSGMANLAGFLGKTCFGAKSCFPSGWNSSSWGGKKRRAGIGAPFLIEGALSAVWRGRDLAVLFLIGGHSGRGRFLFFDHWCGLGHDFPYQHFGGHHFVTHFGVIHGHGQPGLYGFH